MCLAARLSEFVDIHKGEPGLVAASGWSLSDAPVEWLRKFEITFAVNNAYRYYQQRDLQLPKYLVTIDHSFIQKYPDAEELYSEEYLWYIPHMEIRSKIEWMDMDGYLPYQTGNRLICDGSSSHAALHLALIAGCDPIFVIGVDLSIRDNQVYACGDAHRQPNEVVQLSLDSMHEGFRKLSELAGYGRIFDCSLHGKLQCFPKVEPWTN